MNKKGENIVINQIIIDIENNLNIIENNNKKVESNDNVKNTFSKLKVWLKKIIELINRKDDLEFTFGSKNTFYKLRPEGFGVFSLMKFKDDEFNYMSTRNLPHKKNGNREKLFKKIENELGVEITVMSKKGKIKVLIGRNLPILSEDKVWYPF